VKINIPKITLILFYSIKGTVLGQAFWRADTVFVNWPYPCFSLVLHGFPWKLWWRLPYFENLLIFFRIAVPLWSRLRQ